MGKFSRCILSMFLLYLTLSWFTNSGCGSLPCKNGYSSSTISTMDRVCETDCDCNNQQYEGYCGALKKCVAVERDTCKVKGQQETQCDVHFALQSAAGCKIGTRICGENGLGAGLWGNCKCNRRARKESFPEAFSELSSEPLVEHRREYGQEKQSELTPVLENAGQDAGVMESYSPQEKGSEQLVDDNQLQVLITSIEGGGSLSPIQYPSGGKPYDANGVIEAKRRFRKQWIIHGQHLELLTKIQLKHKTTHQIYPLTLSTKGSTMRTVSIPLNLVAGMFLLTGFVNSQKIALGQTFVLQGEKGAPGIDGKNGDSCSIVGSSTDSSGNTVVQLKCGASTKSFIVRKGEKGDTGRQGVQGLSGSKGAKGEQGAQGANGTSCAVSGTSTAPSGNIILSIKCGNQISKINIPQGPKGPKGDKGDQGSPGATASITEILDFLISQSLLTSMNLSLQELLPYPSPYFNTIEQASDFSSKESTALINCINTHCFIHFCKIFDDFEDNKLDTNKWKVSNSGATGAGRVVEQNGDLEISLDWTNKDGYSSKATVQVEASGQSPLDLKAFKVSSEIVIDYTYEGPPPQQDTRDPQSSFHFTVAGVNIGSGVSNKKGEGRIRIVTDFANRNVNGKALPNQSSWNLGIQVAGSVGHRRRGWAKLKIKGIGYTVGGGGQVTLVSSIQQTLSSNTKGLVKSLWEVKPATSPTVSLSFDGGSNWINGKVDFLISTNKPGNKMKLKLSAAEVATVNTSGRNIPTILLLGAYYY